MILVLLLDLYAYLRRNLLPHLLCALSLVPCTCASAQTTRLPASDPQRLHAPSDQTPPSLFADLPSTAPLVRLPSPGPRDAPPKSPVISTAMQPTGTNVSAPQTAAPHNTPAPAQVPCCTCPPRHGPSVLSKVTFIVVVVGGLLALVLVGARS